MNIMTFGWWFCLPILVSFIIASGVVLNFYAFLSSPYK